MNDPNRKIDVNISSLLSLKAELLRKQTEVNQAKSRQAAQPFVPKSFERVNNVKDKPNVESKSGPRTNRVELEDSEQLERSRKILEAKSKFYDRMAASGGAVNTDDNCLVMFNAKKQATRVESSSSEESDSENEKGAPELGEEDWVEYTDSLGRTRKCLRTDLEFFKKRDETLAKEFGDQVKEKPPTIEASQVDDADNADSSVESESEDELLKTGRQIQQMRDHWDRQEEENKDKEFVHYQDVLFDEARTHGVGYFQFSTDAEERIKQQKELDVRRKATLTAQNERDVQRQARERIIAERVLAAKNRQRGRVGLPPLEKLEESQGVEISGPVPTTTPIGKEKSEEEEIREMDRKSHLRPWDVGKEGTSTLIPAEEKEWTYKSHREPMSQEEWNVKKREERNSEFAPTTSLDKSNVNEKRQMWKVDVRPSYPANPEVFIDSRQDSNFEQEEEEEEEEEKPGLYFTTKKKKLKRKNYQPAEEESDLPVQKRAEIPPPPTFDYYGPSILGLTKKPKPTPSPNLESSIEAGLKFLRNRTDKSQSTSKSMWGANANYGKDM